MHKDNVVVGHFPIRTKLVCSSCGAPGEGTCHCGAPYVTPGQRAEEAVRANPEKSNCAIAEEIGVSSATIRRARQKSTSSCDEVEPRIGRDGKIRKMPRPRPKMDAAIAAVQAIAARGDMPTRNNVRAAGASAHLAQLAVEAFRAAQEVTAEIDETALAKAAETALPKTMKAKFDIALKHALKQMEREFEQRVRQRSQENDEKLWKPHYDEKLKLAEAIVAGRDGVFTKADFNKILACLHPDHIASLGEDWAKRHNEAFRLFREAEIKLVGEKESPQIGDVPWTLDELLQRKQDLRAARAAQRAEKKEA